MSSTNVDVETALDMEFFLSWLLGIFVTIPAAIMFVRFISRSMHDGLSAMFEPPKSRTVAHELRVFLFQRSNYGFILDVVQALFSAFSCIFFIVISYMGSEPVWISDVEYFFTAYFILGKCFIY